MKHIMKRSLTLLCALGATLALVAQNVTRQYDNVSFSEALKDLNAAQTSYVINFVYNELEDFRVTKDLRNISVPDAVQQLIGFYPIKMTQVDNVLLVECTQKAATKMIGRIVDENRNPVELASVALLNVRDSSVITGGVTNENGQFVVPCEAQSVIVKVSYVGYATVYRTSPVGHVGEIVLKESAQNLRTAVVKAHHKVFKTDGTSLVVDVQKSVLSDIGSADDVVSQLPTVSGSDGSYTVFGRGSAQVYINNRKMRDESELSRLRSKDIATIEIINNPGVEYDADAHAVIKINLRRKPANGFGVRASVFDSQGRRNSDSEQLQLTFDTSSFNAFLSLANSSNRYKTDQTNAEQTTVGADQWRMQTDMPRWTSFYYNQTLTAGISATVAKNHELGASVAYSKETDRWGGLSESAMHRNGELYEDLTSRILSHAYYDQWIANVFYAGTFADKWKLAFNADYVNRSADDDRQNQEEGSLTALHTTKNANETRHNIYAANLKLSYQVNKRLAFSIGTDASQVDEKKNYESRENGEESSQSRLNAEETKFAAFAGCNFSVARLSAQVGVRFETFRMNYRDGLTQEALVRRTQRHLYPYFSLSLPVKNVKMGLSMSTKVKRPSYYELRNSEEYLNRYSIEVGNPLLLPQYTSDVSYSLQWRQFRFSVDYQRVKDYLISTNIVRQSDPLIAASRTDNFPHYSALSASLSYHTNVGLWEPYVNLNVMRTYLTLRNSDGSQVNNRRPYASLSFNNYLNLPHSWMPYLLLSYNTDGCMREYHIRQALWFSVGVTKHFANNAWLIRLSANNLLRTNEHETRFATDYAFDKQTFKDGTRISLLVRYTFKDRKRYKGENSASQEMDRL